MAKYKIIISFSINSPAAKTLLAHIKYETESAAYLYHLIKIAQNMISTYYCTLILILLSTHFKTASRLCMNLWNLL